MNKLRVGIAGYGVVGRRRRRYIDQNPKWRTVAVSDTTFPSDKLDIDGATSCREYSALFEHALDVVFVCLPTYLAAVATIEALGRGLHVFCEKPPGRSVADVLRVIEAEDRASPARLKYGFNHRYHHAVQATHRIIHSGKYGEVINLRAVYGKSAIVHYDAGWRAERSLAGGGILLDQGIHMLDMIRYFCGDFDEVLSMVSNTYWEHDVEDNVFALLRARNGCVASIHSTATQWKHKFRLEITLRELSIELSGILSGSKSYGSEQMTIVPRKDGSATGSFDERTTTYLEDPSWKAEVDEFATLVTDGGIVAHGSSADALAVMRLIESIYQADPQWRRIVEATTGSSP